MDFEGTFYTSNGFVRKIATIINSETTTKSVRKCFDSC